jgi:hypothetical protein
MATTGGASAEETFTSSRAGQSPRRDSGLGFSITTNPYIKVTAGNGVIARSEKFKQRRFGSKAV